MAATSMLVTVQDPATGRILIVDADANIFGMDTLGNRPASGDIEGDMFVLNDGAGKFGYHIWDGSAWQRMTIQPPSGGSVDNRLMRWDGTDGDLAQNSGVVLNDSDQMSLLQTCTFVAEVDNGTPTTTLTIDWNSGQKQRVILGGNVTFSFTDPPGPCNLMLKMSQDATPPRDPVWPASVLWAGGAEPTWSVGASDVDIIAFYFDGTNYYAVGSLDFS
jgi:hypothetical protein